MKVETEGKKIRVKWTKSTIGQNERHKKIMKALGFKRLNQIRTLPDHPSIRGMISHVPHLIEVID